MRIFTIPIAVLQFIIRVAGVFCCVLYITASSSKLVEMLRKKKARPDNRPIIKLDLIRLPEVAKKLQQSY